MTTPSLTVYCNESATGKADSDGTVKLRTYGSHKNVRLKLDHLGRQLNRNLPDRLVDLVEIAAMVYIADQIAHRGADDVESMGANWRRNLRFEIPVREPDFWTKADVRSALVDLLSFLSEDCYEFVFSKFRSPPALERYLVYGTDGTQTPPQSVILFSGGLDSLGGVVDRVVRAQEPAILVSHESSPKLRTRLRALRGMIDAATGDSAPEHVTVTVNKEGLKERDYTQRSRSFLYASLATAVARLAGLDAIRFFENGVVSLNLPLSPQIIGSRATRTTHPKVLASMRRLFSMVTDCEFAVTNEFIWKTKAEVVRGIVDAGHGAMVPLSTSCTHTWEMTIAHPHCGTCSQCIDRRFAVLAGGAGELERPESYAVDLLVGERPKGESRIMLASYVETAQQIERMTPGDFFSRYGEAARALRHVELSADEAAQKIFDLYQRHAKEVLAVIESGVARNGRAIRSRTLPQSCLIRLVHDPRPSSGVASVQAVAAAEAPQFQLRRVGEGWDLWFEGRQVRLLPRIGLIHLAHLLYASSHAASVATLHVAARPTPADMQGATLPVAKGEVAMDGVMFKAIVRKLQENAEDRALAEKNGDEAELDRLDADTADLERALKASNYKGRRKLESREYKQLRDRVCNAIRVAIKGIEPHDRRAAAHFRDAMKYGGTIRYAPAQLPDWEP